MLVQVYCYHMADAYRLRLELGALGAKFKVVDLNHLLVEVPESEGPMGAIRRAIQTYSTRHQEVVPVDTTIGV